MPQWRQSMARNSAAALWRSTKRVRAKSARAHLVVNGGTPIFADKEMKFFATTSPRKVKTGPVIKRLLVRCPSTAKLTATGQTIEEALWAAAKVKTPKFTCPHCRQVHSWTKKDVVLAR